MSYLTDPRELSELIGEEPPYRADQLHDWLYKTPVLTPEEMTNLPPGLRETVELWPFDVETEQSTDDGTTIKWLFRASDGMAIESVLMGYRNRTTLCISSQAGCALGCTFCATGQFGFDRHLEPGEIVAQVQYANAWLRRHPIPGSPGRVTNIVFMGMGEPLANYDRVRESIRRMIEHIGMGARSITVSTVGVVPGMLRLAEEPWQVGLAVSLHAADDDLRSSIVPINKRYPLADVEAAAANYFQAKGRRVSIEWTMLAGINDDVEQARKLAPIARRLRAHINLIAMNPTPMSIDQPSSRAVIELFASTLTDLGANVTIRNTRGQEIDAACGQLRIRSATERGSRS